MEETPRRRRKSAKQASASMLLILIVSAAMLAFLPFRVTLAAGNAETEELLNNIRDSLGFVGPLVAPFLGLGTPYVRTELGLAGTRLEVDGVGVFADSKLVGTLLDSAGLPVLFGDFFRRMDYFGIKSQRVLEEFSNNRQPNVWTPGYATSPTPLFPDAQGDVLQIRILALSVTISGYLSEGIAVDPRYNETSLVGLNPAMIISLDRLLIDLFIDPVSGMTTYLVSADMTVYQAVALLLAMSLL